MATINKTRPNCAKVKVEVNLLRELPKRINVGIKKKRREKLAKQIQIKYDFLPKYCHTCKLQGHNKKNYFVLYPELFDDGKKENKDNKKEVPKKGAEVDNTNIIDDGNTQNNGKEPQECKHREG